MGWSATRQRSVGRIAATFTADGGRTRLDTLHEAGPLRLRIPRGETHLQAVMLNTGGGICCGDRMDVAVTAQAGAEVTVTSQAAERIYRSDGPTAHIDVTLAAEAGSVLHWIPQETILFDRGRLSRSYAVRVQPDASFLSFEAVVFGRISSGEEIGEGLLHDSWRIQRGDQLVFADALRLDGDIAAKLDRPAIAAGARAVATFLYVAPDAESRLDEVRSRLAAASIPCGASAWRGLLVVRFLSPEIGTLRRAAAPFLAAFTGRPMPRVWML
jgi:urease accessory protein